MCNFLQFAVDYRLVVFTIHDLWMEKLSLNASTAITEIVPLNEYNDGVSKTVTPKIGAHSIKPIDLKDKRVLNVAFVHQYSGCGGGIVRVHQILTTELAKRQGYRVFEVAKQETRVHPPVVENVTKVIIPDQWDKHIPSFQEKEHIDVIVDSGQGLLSEECVKKLRKNLCKIISVYHTAYCNFAFRNLTIKNFDIQKSLIRSDVLCVLSKVDAKLRRLSGIKQSMYMPNPLTFDLDKITPSPLTSKNILFVGRINDVYVKRPKLAIQAFGEIVKKVPDAKLQMVGACPDGVKKELSHEAKRLNIPENSIEFPGLTLDVDKFYRNAAVLIMPSLYESWGMVLTEAKAYGLPNIVTKMEYLETTKNGTIVVGKDDAAGIAREAIKLLTDDEYRHQQGKLARESLEEFRNEYVIDKWEQLLHAVVDSKESTQKFVEQQPSVDEEYALRIAREEYDATKPYNDYTRIHPFTLFPLNEEEKIRRELREMDSKKRDVQQNRKKDGLIKKDNVNAFVWHMMQRMKKRK